MSLFLSACKFGGEISAGLANIPQPVPSLEKPIVLSPAQRTYYSNASTLSLSGYCDPKARISLINGVESIEDCPSNGEFEFLVTKNSDGIYPLIISQLNIHNQRSESVSITWIRKTSVPPPTLTSPATTTFSSGLNTITLQGTCESGNVISLGGDSSGNTSCTNSSFSINVSKALFGTYNIELTQTDPANNSATLNLTWVRESLNISPSSAMIQVATDQVISIDGGNGEYTISFDENNSGATFDSNTLTYTSGTIAGVTDLLTISDSDGLEGQLSVTTVPSTPDHLVAPAWSDPSVLIGEDGPENIVVQVVDQYGNGVPDVAMAFEVIEGDLEFTSSPRQSSDANGEVQVSYKMGKNLKSHKVRISPVSQTLPDVNDTGTKSVELRLSSETEGNGDIGPFYETGPNPLSVTSADFDQDGEKDLVYINNGSNEMAVQINKGGALFEAADKYTLNTCSNATKLVTADFDNNTFEDILVLCSGTNTLARYSGNGDGTFNTLATIGGAAAQETIAAHDFNIDGNMDIAIASSSSDQIRIYTGNGDFTFTHLVDLSTQQLPTDIQIADLDGNGFDDLISTNNLANSITVFMNSGSPSFDAGTNIAVGIGPVQSLVKDLNDDGDLDLMVLCRDEWNGYVYLNDGAGNLVFESNPAFGNTPINAAFVDYNKDTHLDIVVSNEGDQNIGILQGNGSGNFQAMNTVDAFGVVSSMQFNDLDADGIEDFIYTNSTTEEVYALSAQSSGGYGLKFDLPSSPLFSGSADFNEDGIPDLFFLNSNNTISFYEGQGDNKFEFETSLITGGTPKFAKVIDLNADGKNDILIVNNLSHTFTLYYGGDDWNFSTKYDFPTALNPTAIHVADFNSDGLYDVAASGTGLSKISITLGDTDTIFGPKIEYNSGSSPQDIKGADLNLDGYTDLVTADQSGNGVSVFLGNGDGTFRTPISVLTGSSPTRLALDDFNRDGAVDMITMNTMNTGDGGISYLRGNGDGSFVSPSSTFAGGSPTDMQVGDFNGDAYTDVIVANGNANTATILFGVNGTFNTSKTLNLSFSLEGIFVGQINSDSKLDIGFTSTNTNKAELWLGQ